VQPVTWGIVSTAHINRLLIPGAKASPKVDLVGVASRDRARAEEYARKWEIPRAYGSYEALLADPEIDAVYISLPNTLHVEWSVRALEAGKHVLCEKPLSRDAGAVEEAFDAADRAGRLLTEAFMYRHNPQTKRLHELVRDGAIGELRLVRAAFSYGLYDEENIRLRPELEGGALMDVGCYCVSALRLLAGEPTRVAAERVDGGRGVDARMAGVLRFQDGVLGTFDCAFDVPYRAGIEVVGSEATIVSLDPWHGTKPEVRVLRPDAEPEEVPVEAANPYGLELDDFARAVREGGEPRLGREDAVGQARVIEALYAAAAQ
jgi:predicted dehydrogenase